MDGIELVAFKIISTVGTARSMYIEAIQLAKTGDIKKAKELIEEGEKVFIEGHHHHAELIQMEANKEELTIGLLIIHAEDQLMSAEAIKIMANEFIDVYERLLENE